MIPSSTNSTILITNEDNIGENAIPATVVFRISLYGGTGSVLVVVERRAENCGCNSACTS
jgi:hypothetical protein